MLAKKVKNSFIALILLHCLPAPVEYYMIPRGEGVDEGERRSKER